MTAIPRMVASSNSAECCKLREGGSRNHGANFGESSVVANAGGIVGDAEPNAAAARLTARARAQSSMISPRMLAMPPMRSRALGRIRIQPPAAAAVLRSAPGHPGRRIEHEEEKDEGRDQQGFSQRTAAQLDHQRNQIEVVCFGARHQFGDVIWPVDDVGIGEEQIVRRERTRRVSNLRRWPKVCRTNRREAARLGSLHACFRCHRGRPIGTVIIHHDDVPGAERRNGRADNGLFVAGRNDDANAFANPNARRLGRSAICQKPPRAVKR